MRSTAPRTGVGGGGMAPADDLLRLREVLQNPCIGRMLVCDAYLEDDAK